MSLTRRHPEWYAPDLPLYTPWTPPPGVRRLVGGMCCARPGHPPTRFVADSQRQLDLLLDQWECRRCVAEGGLR